MKERIRELLEQQLPLVNFDSAFLVSELASLGLTLSMLKLAQE